MATARGEGKHDDKPLETKREKHRSPSWEPLTPESGTDERVSEDDGGSPPQSETHSDGRSSVTPEGKPRDFVAANFAFTIFILGRGCSSKATISKC